MHQLVIAFLQGLRTGLQGLTLRQQWALVDDGANEVDQVVLGIVNARNVQVAGKKTIGTGGKLEFTEFAGTIFVGRDKTVLDLPDVSAMHQREQEIERRVVFQGAQQCQCPRVMFQNLAVFIDHHQRQRHTGKQRDKTVRGPFGSSLAKAQGAVLNLQFSLRAPQVFNQAGIGIAASLSA